MNINTRIYGLVVIASIVTFIAPTCYTKNYDDYRFMSIWCSLLGWVCLFIAAFIWKYEDK